MGNRADQDLHLKRSDPLPPFDSRRNRTNNNSYLLRSTSDHLLNRQGDGAGIGFVATHPPLYSSYPPPFPIHSSRTPIYFFQRPHPPLLPLPPSSASLSSPSPRGFVRSIIGRPPVSSAIKDHKKPSSSPAISSTRLTSSPAITATSLSKDEASKQGDFTGDVYRLSPPPSSLPMPKFSLRTRMLPPPPSSSGNALAAGKVEAEVLESTLN